MTNVVHLVRFKFSLYLAVSMSRFAKHLRLIVAEVAFRRKYILLFSYSIALALMVLLTEE